MALLPFLVGLACVAWTLYELVGAARRAARAGRMAGFAAIDPETLRPLPIQVDRRTRDRRARRARPTG